MSLLPDDPRSEVKGKVLLKACSTLNYHTKTVSPRTPERCVPGLRRLELEHSSVCISLLFFSFSFEPFFSKNVACVVVREVGPA
jgi:hypothetical protein